MRLLLYVIMSFVVLTGQSQAQIEDGGFDKELFDQWVSMRVGDGNPVYWYSTGTVRAYSSGDTLATVEGYDTARLVLKNDEPNSVYQLSRKTYIYHDTKTGERLREVNGNPLLPIQYPYQFISYQLDGDQIETMVEQGRSPYIQKIGPGRDISAQRLGGGVSQFTAPVFLNFPIPSGGNYEAFENYDFFLQPDSVDRSARYQLSWVRYGTLPPFNNGKPVIMHMVAWRYDKFEDIPATMREYVETEAPLWRAPPRDLEDIRSLQVAERSN